MRVPALLLLLTVSALAHHSWVDFDTSREVSITGKVLWFYFVNPHCVAELDVDGKTVQVEFSSPGPLRKIGWSAATLQPGDRITATGNPPRDPDNHALHAWRIQLPDGKDVEVEAPADRAK